MNRSLSNGRRTSSHSKLKDLNNEKNSVGFQTFLKSRIDHGIIKQATTNIKKKVTRTEAFQNQDQNKLQNDLMADSQLKPLNRTSRIVTEEQDKDKFRLSTIQQKQNNLRDHLSFSQFQPVNWPFKKNLEDFGSNINYLDILEKKVQDLLEVKLLKKSQMKSFMNFRIYEDDLEKELQALVLQLQQYSTGADQNLNKDIDLDIKEMAQKIGILEKIIAESFTQSEILKKYYYMKKMSRKSFRFFQNPLRKSHGQEAPSRAPRLASSIPQHPSLHFTSISKSSYSKPNREAYRMSEKSAPKVVMNRQNMCRSNYQSEFFNYGPLPVYPKMKQQKTTLSAVKMMEQKSTIYKAEFIEKKTEIIDSMTLDCRRDKFKPTKIMFVPKDLLQDKQNMVQKAKPKKIASLKHKMVYEELASNPKLTTASSYSSLYKESSLGMYNSGVFSNPKSTEYTASFAGDKSIVECLVKNANLANLKYQFKNNVKA